MLKLAGATAATAILNVTAWRSPGLAADAIRSEWTFSAVFGDAGIFATPVLVPDTRFDSIDASWLAERPDRLSLEVRTRSKAGVWSDWSPLHADNHRRTDEEARVFSAPILRTGSALQVRVQIESGAALRELKVGTLDTGAVAAPHTHAAPIAPIDGFIVPRAGWGADESLRHEDRDSTKPLVWPPRYQDIEKIILHHTATDNQPLDVGAAIRSVYFYHAITREWGDIGYNFLIDHAGNVYEGRFGGPNVIGGHALRYNPGSIGISLLGNFDLANPPQPMIDAFVRLVKTRAAHVDVTTASDFVDLIGLANLSGHGDVLKTSCPGEYCRPLLPAIRGRIAGTGPIELPPPIRREWLELLDCSIGPSTVYQGNLLEVHVRVQNIGILPIETAGPEPGFIYDETQDYESAGYPKVANTYRFGLDFDGNRGTANPFRWGFEGTIAPGEEREAVGYVRMSDIDTRTFSVSVVKEFVHYLSENLFPSDVAVAPPPVAPAPRSAEPGDGYHEVTGHNVPAPFHAYWLAKGGLRRFGYPLTEAFEEVSETDGGRYLTQYFERARFELHPEYEGTEYYVLLGLVGVETTMTRRQEPDFATVQPFDSTSDRLYFPETGHSLGGIFKQVWEARGGLPIFGYPISEEFRERSDTDGVVHTVQYFERNRFEHHPGFAGTYDEVMFGHLAREILIQRGWLPGA